MKKILILGFLICASGYAWSETIQAVGYNPARFGEYKRLKVTSGMETGGALVSPTLDGNGRSVTLSACEGECEEAAYRVERIESVNNGTVTSTGMTAGTVNGARGTVNMGNNSEIKSAVKGGEVAVKQLSASGSGLSVSENLTLGGNKIKKPGYTNCQWKWETITHEGGSAKVLALAGCSDICNNPSAQERCETESHGGGIGTWNLSTCSCDCPSGMELDMHGQCDCISGYNFDSKTNTCTKNKCSEEKKIACDQEAIDGLFGTWHEDTCVCECPKGYELNKDGRCDCPQGTMFSYASGAKCIDCRNSICCPFDQERALYRYYDRNITECGREENHYGWGCMDWSACKADWATNPKTPYPVSMKTEDNAGAVCLRIVDIADGSNWRLDIGNKGTNMVCIFGTKISDGDNCDHGDPNCDRDYEDERY